MGDIDITSLANGEILQYNSTASKWINQTFAEANIATTTSLSAHTGASNNPHGVTASQVNLGNVTNESKATMFTDPVFTGNPTAVTQTEGNSSTRLATTEFVGTAINNLIGGAGAALDTLVEIEEALGSDDSLANTLTNSIATKAPLADPTFTGTPEAPTASSGTNNTQIATTEFVNTALSPKANIASPALTGTPTAPTASLETNSTQIATTEFVQSLVDTKDTLAELNDVSIDTQTLAALQVIRYNANNSQWENQPLSAILSVQPITLGPHTTGNYVATIAAASGSPISVTGSGSENASVQLDISDATTSVKGVASFDSDDFNVSGGAVSLKETYLTAHPTISAATSSDNSGRTYIQDITLDSFGHITGISTAEETVTVPSWVPSTDPNYLTAHPTISAATSSDNSGRTYIQDITLDSFGHITGISTAEETVTVPSWVPSTDPNYLTAHPTISAATSSDNSELTYKILHLIVLDTLQVYLQQRKQLQYLLGFLLLILII